MPFEGSGPFKEPSTDAKVSLERKPREKVVLHKTPFFSILLVREPHCAAKGGEKQTLSEQLTHQSAAARADRQSYCHFPLSGCGAG
jgi:hypothetical protein